FGMDRHPRQPPADGGGRALDWWGLQPAVADLRFEDRELWAHLWCRQRCRESVGGAADGWRARGDRSGRICAEAEHRFAADAGARAVDPGGRGFILLDGGARQLSLLQITVRTRKPPQGSVPGTESAVPAIAAAPARFAAPLPPHDPCQRADHADARTRAARRS